MLTSNLERGDYQTPKTFSDYVCKYLKEERIIDPDIIFEPTCGKGNFIISAIENFETVNKVYGVEIYEKYVLELEEKLKSYKTNYDIKNQSIFTYNYNNVNYKENDKLLILGNPPWVTNSELKKLGSENLPPKSNLKKNNGMDSITGKSNFDISEYIILELIKNFEGSNAVIAMLCKNSVIRNIIKFSKDVDMGVKSFQMVNFDANKIFNISVDASLFIIELGENNSYTCEIKDFDKTGTKTLFGWMKEENYFVSDMRKYDATRYLEGKMPFIWRQGLKHDASKVMQLDSKDGYYTNGYKDNIEASEYIYPLLKSSDIKTFEKIDNRKSVIVTQKKTGEKTGKIKTYDIKLWNYLEKYSEILDNRKSSIYKNAPRFSIFGIGDYSFKPYKVAVSGFYKKPIFSLVYNKDNIPVMLDDTCYFIGFDEYSDAFITMIFLNSKLVQDFLVSIVFIDNKRPYTKEILQRINLRTLIQKTSFVEFKSICSELKYETKVSQKEYEKYSKKILKKY